MKIAYLSLNLFPSHYAHTVQIMRMCEAFTAQGHEVTLFAKKSDRYRNGEELFYSYGVKEPFQIIWINNRLVNKYHYFKIVANHILKIKNKYDLIYTRSHITALISCLFRKKVIYEIHDLPKSKSQNLLFSLITVSKYVKFVFISEKLSRLYFWKYKIQKGSFIVQHDGAKINSDSKMLLPDELNRMFNTEKVNVLYTGNFYKGRGIDLISKLAELNNNLNFICVGGNTTELQKINNHSINLFFYGRVDNVLIPSILGKADILLMPYSQITTIEGKGNTADFCSPMKMGEYLAAGKPILSSNLPSLVEVLNDEVNAIVCSPDNSEEWDKKLKELVNDEIKKVRLSHNALLTATHISWHNRVNNILRCLC